MRWCANTSWIDSRSLMISAAWPLTSTVAGRGTPFIWVDCTSAEELGRLAAALGEGGSMLMPVGSYGFSSLFCWVADEFGVTWQLNLP